MKIQFSSKKLQYIYNRSILDIKISLNIVGFTSYSNMCNYSPAKMVSTVCYVEIMGEKQVLLCYTLMQYCITVAVC